jgi:site-specific DNA-methyltransferase (adenine-specific)
MFRKNRYKRLNKYGHSNIFECTKIKDKIHPSQKDLNVLKKIIELTTTKDDVILDPFSGSGITLLAAKLLDRQSIGIEIDHTYYSLSKNMLNI